MLITYNNKLKARARELRNKSTLSEVLLWKHLKKKQIRGYQFLRQKPVGNYIVDFYCPNLKLVIEIDGSSHDNKQEYDKYRDEYLKEIGLRVVRFLDNDVKNSLEAVIQSIKNEMLKIPL